VLSGGLQGGKASGAQSHWVAIALRLQPRASAPGTAEQPCPAPRMQMREQLVAGTYKDSPQLSKYRNRVSTKLSCS